MKNFKMSKGRYIVSLSDKCLVYRSINNTKTDVEFYSYDIIRNIEMIPKKEIRFYYQSDYNYAMVTIISNDEHTQLFDQHGSRQDIDAFFETFVSLKSKQ